MRDWLVPDRLAWFVIDAVSDIDLSAFHGAYRADGHSAAAYESSMMVTLLLYTYATKQRSSRDDRTPLSPGRGVPGDHAKP